MQVFLINRRMSKAEYMKEFHDYPRMNAIPILFNCFSNSCIDITIPSTATYLEIATIDYKMHAAGKFTTNLVTRNGVEQTTDKLFEL